MRMNRKAVGGFMEAIAAMMVVCIALTAFMGLMAYNQTSDVQKEIDFCDCVRDNTEISNGTISFDDSDINEYIERYGLGKVSVRLGVHTTSGDIRFEQTCGEDDRIPENILCDKGSFTICCDDGASYSMNYEVGYWYS